MVSEGPRPAETPERGTLLNRARSAHCRTAACSSRSPLPVSPCDSAPTEDVVSIAINATTQSPVRPHSLTAFVMIALDIVHIASVPPRQTRPAVDQQRNARDVIRFVAGQKKEGVGALFGRAELAQRDGGGRRGAYFGSVS